MSEPSKEPRAHGKDKGDSQIERLMQGIVEVFRPLWDEQNHRLDEIERELSRRTDPVVEPSEPAYRVEVARRKPSDVGYTLEPYSAVAWRGQRMVAVQYGNLPGLAFQKAWGAVQRDRECNSVVAHV